MTRPNISAGYFRILIKDAATLENVSRITAIVLDKTGMLTEGRPAVTNVIAAGATIEQDLLRLVASAEQGSEHRWPRRSWPARASDWLSQARASCEARAWFDKSAGPFIMQPSP